MDVIAVLVLVLAVAALVAWLVVRRGRGGQRGGPGRSSQGTASSSGSRFPGEGRGQPPLPGGPDAPGGDGGDGGGGDGGNGG